MTRLYDNLRRVYEDFPVVPVLSVDNVAEYIYDKYEPYTESWKEAPTLAPMLNPVFIETLKPPNSPSALPNKWGVLLDWTDKNLYEIFCENIVNGLGMPSSGAKQYWDMCFGDAHWLMIMKISYMVDGRLYLNDFGGFCALNKQGAYIHNTMIYQLALGGHLDQIQRKFMEKHSITNPPSSTVSYPKGHIIRANGADNVIEVDKPQNGDSLDTFIHPMLTVLMMGLTLAHCKNVELIDQTPPPKLSKRAERHYNMPLIKYHILKVNPLRSVIHNLNEDEPLKKSGGSYPKPLSIWRGHFKDFRDGKGLFGKYKEIYWWDQHIRGNEENGVVIKDYAVTEPVGELV